MEVLHYNDCEEKNIETFPYKGKNYKVQGVTIRWLSQAGPKESPDYGLRFFKIAPGGGIPIHKHFYYQTMYILTGNLVVYAYDSETDKPVTERTVGMNDFIFIPSMEPHSMKNLSETENATFLCCIANVYEEDKG